MITKESLPPSTSTVSKGNGLFQTCLQNHTCGIPYGEVNYSGSPSSRQKSMSKKKRIPKKIYLSLFRIFLRLIFLCFEQKTELSVSGRALRDVDRAPITSIIFLGFLSRVYLKSFWRVRVKGRLSSPLRR